MQRTDPHTDSPPSPPESAVNALGVAEMFALWSLRLWVLAYRSGGNLLPDLRRGFALAGMPDAWLDLDEFLTRMLGNVRRPLDIRSVAGPTLSPDELGILHWLAGLQRQNLPAAQCDRLKTIAVAGERLALGFAAAGLVFGACADGNGFAAAAPGDIVLQ